MSSKVQTTFTPSELTITKYPTFTIKHVDDVKRVVNGMPEFVFRYRDGFIFSSYKRVTSDTFPIVPAEKLSEQQYLDFLFRREIRGLAFDEATGLLVSRCLHKFFNINERPDSSEHVLQNLIQNSLVANEPIYVMDKLDGSMIAPLIAPGNKIRLRTKMGFNNNTSNACELEMYGTSDINLWPSVDEILANYEQSVNEHERVLYFCAKWLTKGYTPMFEFYTKDTMIVIQYDKSFFTLIAMRETESGAYVSYDDMKQFTDEVNIPLVQAIQVTEDKTLNAKQVISMVKSMEGKEGCVLRFADGQMFKLKSDWYTDLHRIKQHLVYNAVNEGNVWALVFDERVDDAIPLLTTHEQNAVKSFNDDLWRAISLTTKRAIDFCEEHKSLEQRQFADLLKNTVKNSLWARVLFAVRKVDQSEAEDQLVSIIRSLLFKDLNMARKLLDAPNLLFFTNYMKNTRELTEDDI